MPQGNNDNRKHPRFLVQVPIVILRSPAMPSGGKGLTRDVSEAGIFFHTESPLPQGLHFDFKVVMPSEITRSESKRATCRGRVVRVEESPDGRKIGIAAAVECVTWS